MAARAGALTAVLEERDQALRLRRCEPQVGLVLGDRLEDRGYAAGWRAYDDPLLRDPAPSGC